MILVIDNYDSFTYNLVHYIGECNHEVLVKRNDALTVSEIHSLNPEKIVISPGPCTPNEAGISVEIIQESQVPLLGVCLGHQSIGAAFGAKIIKAPEVFHGKKSNINHSNSILFKDIPDPYSVVRYHSLIIDSLSLPKDLKVGWPRGACPRAARTAGCTRVGAGPGLTACPLHTRHGGM